MSRDRFHRFWFFEIDPFVLGLFRVCLGLFTLLLLALLSPWWTTFYGPGSLNPQPLLQLADYRPFDPLIRLISTQSGMWAFYSVSVVAAVCLTLGLLTRLATVWLWLCAVSLYYGSRVANGEEQILSLLLFFSIFLPLAESCRFDQLFRRDARKRMFQASRKVPVWTLRVLQVHLMLIYLISLPPKLQEPAWREGTAVYYAMMAMSYPRWPGLEIFAWGDALVSRILTWLTLGVELIAPLAVWFRRFRTASVLALMGLHLGLALLLEGIVMFNLAMIVALVLFLPSRRTRELFARVFS